MRFAVQRHKWRCGGDGPSAHGFGTTYLLNDEGYRCCLGFVAQQCGHTDSQIRRLGEPCEDRELSEVLVTEVYDQSNECTKVVNSALADKAVSINDEKELSRDERESRLIALFSYHGHELVFEGAYETRGK